MPPVVSSEATPGSIAEGRTLQETRVSGERDPLLY
jgi:hypothetical protein